MNEWLLIITTLLLSAFFSGSEIAFISANRLKLEVKSRRGTPNAASLGFFLRHPETFLSTTLIGNNIVNVTYATMMAVVLTDQLSVAGKAVVASIIIMIWGEILPKAIFRTYPDAFVSAVVGPLRVIAVVLHPLVVLANAASSVIIRMFRIDPHAQPIHIGRADFEHLFREIGTEPNGQLDRDDSEILTNVLELGNIRVKDSMVPRTDIVAVEQTTALTDVRDAFIQSGFSKLPVYDESIDNIVGVVVAYDLFKNPESLAAIIKPVNHVPMSQKSRDLLEDFRKQQLNMAIVIDEYGGTAGLITIEDLLEEVVGDIQDEYDIEDRILKQLSDGSWLLSGGIETEDLAGSHPQIGIPSEDVAYETVAGFVMHEAGRIPKVGEEIRIGAFRITILKAKRSRIELIKLQYIG